MSRPKFVAGNWKMYTTRAGAVDLAAAVAKGLPAGGKTRVAVCPPFPWLTAVADALKGTPVAVGAQNCHFEKEGAFTGETAPGMILDAGCQYVIIGHSERRHGFGETDGLLNKKTKAALAAGLSVIFCVGELLAEREASQTEKVLETQLTHGLADLSAAQLEKVVVAYEPVWAIGTGKVATTEQAQAAHAFIRQKIAGQFGEKAAAGLLIQYGGSVKPDNAAALLHQPDVDGALVGGASLKADTFLAIVAAGG
ncbi:triose-phosphate isomerase [Fimbriiglobus ruber]|uniref:Triosephosphate isomerase n=1 Tax=Fimbriiglobus ruber TaxID=1908690 RepID=A0A225DMP7_9BACT|nr:triose-phosphate isomerase [Fimbriiglobus ruber]OWK37467.1 Triosephosphate isomerase [Fimbriiglobus ruber]